jgi:5'-3' exonuclease
MSQKNKLTLIIDANWLLISRASVLINTFNKSLPDIAKEQAQQDLENLLAKSINVILHRFPCIDNIILTADGGSWRKQLPKPSIISDVVYKGNRSQDTDIDWSYIYKALNNLINTASEFGITVTQYQNIEGDDWVWYWSRRLNSEGINCLIWSSDNDLKQLIQVDDNTNAFTAWYNDKNGLWLPDVLQDQPDDLDFFFKFEYFSPVLESLKRPSKSINYIDPSSVITSKIICGDAGDNIMSVFRYQKGNRTYRITEKEWSQISEKCGVVNIDSLLSNIDNISRTICEHEKYIPHTPDQKLIEEMIKYNIRLVWLNEYSIPDTIIQLMNQQEYKKFDISYIKSNYRVLVGSDNMIENLFNSI